MTKKNKKDTLEEILKIQQRKEKTEIAAGTCGLIVIAPFVILAIYLMF